MFDLQTYLAQKRASINAALQDIMGGDGIHSEHRIHEAMRYSLEAGGKRVRPILSIAAAESAGGQESTVIPAACAIEMIHTYSLIHDDLPAMDNDSLRRGKPTSHIEFDEATAILAGDALLTFAFEILSGAEYRKNCPPSTALDVIAIIAAAAGRHGMIEGQMRDILAEGNHLDVRQLESIHRLKTGALIEASVHIGAILGGAAEEQIEKLRIFGRQIGIAFQVMDDILNVKGDPSLMGKAVGSDAKRGKLTYPALMGLAKSEALATRSIETGLHAISGFDKKAEPLRAIARYIIERKK